MAKDPAFPFYAQDFIVDTFQWSRSHKGFHCELMSIAWINGFLEADESGFPVGIDDEGKRLWTERVGLKWVLKNGKLFNERLETERVKRQVFKEKQTENGKKGGKKPKSNPNDTQTLTQTLAKPIPKTKPLEKENEKDNEKEKKDRKEVVHQQAVNVPFLVFWDLYDKKRGDRHKLEKKWLTLTDIDRERIMAFVPDYKRSQPDKAFRKDPDTFLNNKSWNDELIFKPHATGKKPAAINGNHKDAGALIVLESLRSEIAADG